RSSSSAGRTAKCAIPNVLIQKRNESPFKLAWLVAFLLPLLETINQLSVILLLPNDRQIGIGFNLQPVGVSELDCSFEAFDGANDVPFPGFRLLGGQLLGRLFLADAGRAQRVQTGSIVGVAIAFRVQGTKFLGGGRG